MNINSYDFHADMELCPNCKKGLLKKDKKDFLHNYRDKTISISIEILHCGMCGISLASESEVKRVKSELTNFINKIDGKENDHELEQNRVLH